MKGLSERVPRRRRRAPRRKRKDKYKDEPVQLNDRLRAEHGEPSHDDTDDLHGSDDPDVSDNYEDWDAYDKDYY